MCSETWQALVEKATVCGQKMLHPTAVRRAFRLQDGADIYREYIALPSGSYNKELILKTKCELAGNL